ncbi:unnamed protein product [Periconia digitata]|uniref:Uncharacterized protein n=1 Tax=Periconia digitata TaxID=1303443 RepID=A0A9W4UP13_9PLEO|nr:unnamed protein product [Periconia digitata]
MCWLVWISSKGVLGTAWRFGGLAVAFCFKTPLFHCSRVSQASLVSRAVCSRICLFFGCPRARSGFRRAVLLANFRKSGMLRSPLVGELP